MFLSEFTNEEKERIDTIYGNDFKDVSPEDVRLIARYEASKAYEKGVQDEQAQAAREAAEAETQRCKAEAAYYGEKLKALVNEATARFEEVSGDGK